MLKCLNPDYCGVGDADTICANCGGNMSELEALKFRLSEKERDLAELTDQIIHHEARVREAEIRAAELEQEVWALEDEIAELVEAGS